MDQKRKKVIVGMSGGVDSSVSAALLKKQGFDVVGVFLRFWKESNQDKAFENKCCSLESFEEAKKICKIIGIPLIVANVEKEFKKEVVDYFLDEYASGKTPHARVICNKEIKFNFLIKKILEMKADYVATGHYARIKQEFPISNLAYRQAGFQFPIKSKIIYKLFESADKNKDQTYFLYNLNQKQLSKILFPVGEYEKNAVRKMAKKFKLPVFEKKDSQDVCFIQEKTPEAFLKRNLKMKKGKITDEKGKIIGEHKGLPPYTIVQRKGINIGGSGPYYVIGKDFRKNILVVSNDEKGLFSSKMEVGKVNWIIAKPKLPAKILVKTRYRNLPVSAIIESQKAIYKIKFKNPQRAICPGQSAVFYDSGGEVLGGGIIL